MFESPVIDDVEPVALRRTSRLVPVVVLESVVLGVVIVLGIGLLFAHAITGVFDPTAAQTRDVRDTVTMLTKANSDLADYHGLSKLTEQADGSSAFTPDYHAVTWAIDYTYYEPDRKLKPSTGNWQADNAVMFVQDVKRVAERHYFKCAYPVKDDYATTRLNANLITPLQQVCVGGGVTIRVYAVSADYDTNYATGNFRIEITADPNT